RLERACARGAAICRLAVSPLAASPTTLAQVVSRVCQRKRRRRAVPLLAGEFVFGCGIRLLAQRPRTRDELQRPVRRLPRAKFVMPVSSTLGVSPGVTLWPGFLDRAVQLQVVAEVGARTERAPFYRPRMPRSGKPFSVEETNFGSHGWFSDESGYRYMAAHPVTKLPWPEIPE